MLLLARSILIPEGMRMDKREALWSLFLKTGSPEVYLLYHGKDGAAGTERSPEASTD